MARVIINYGAQEDITGLNHLHCEDCNKELNLDDPAVIVQVEGQMRKLICMACKEKQDVVK